MELTPYTAAYQREEARHRYGASNRNEEVRFRVQGYPQSTSCVGICARFFDVAHDADSWKVRANMASDVREEQRMTDEEVLSQIPLFVSDRIVVEEKSQRLTLDVATCGKHYDIFRSDLGFRQAISEPCFARPTSYRGYVGS